MFRAILVGSTTLKVGVKPKSGRRLRQGGLRLEEFKGAGRTIKFDVLIEIEIAQFIQHRGHFFGRLGSVSNLDNAGFFHWFDNQRLGKSIGGFFDLCFFRFGCFLEPKTLQRGRLFGSQSTFNDDLIEDLEDIAGKPLATLSPEHQQVMKEVVAEVRPARRWLTLNEVPSTSIQSCVGASGGAASSADAGPANAKPSPAATNPRDLSGIWMITGGQATSWDPSDPGGAKPHQLPMTPSSREKLKAARPPFCVNATFDNPNDPVEKYCDPPGLTRMYSFPWQFTIVQTPPSVYILFEYFRIWRMVTMDKPHPKDVDSTWLGDSVGNLKKLAKLA